MCKLTTPFYMLIKTLDKYSLEKLGQSNVSIVTFEFALPFFLQMILKRVMKWALRYDQNAVTDRHRRVAKQTRSDTKGERCFSFSNLLT